MAFENFPEMDKTPSEVNRPVTMQKNTLRTILTAVLVIALLGTWGYIIWDKNNTKETLSQKDTLISSTSTQRDELQRELADATMRYDMLKTTNSQKDSSISVKDKEILEKQDRIKTLLSKSNATQKELSQARSLIASLRNDIDGYKVQIAALEGANQQLTVEKAQVTDERDRYSRNFDSARSVIKKREDVIDIGSTLHASNFNIQGVKEKGGGKEKVTDKAKKVDKLRITFDLDENMITSSGNKEVYVVITSPEGQPVAVEGLGSGKFSTREGQEKIYTQKLDVNYEQNKRQKVSFDWKQNKDFVNGNYKIEVYNNGFKVGEAFKPLKKGGLFS
ncbi:MAG: hypothetical protein ABIP68_03785 [Ferruginibacter sp.]